VDLESEEEYNFRGSIQRTHTGKPSSVMCSETHVSVENVLLKYEY
jgi:hypothetical protein